MSTGVGKEGREKGRVSVVENGKNANEKKMSIVKPNFVVRVTHESRRNENWIVGTNRKDSIGRRIVAIYAETGEKK